MSELLALTPEEQSLLAQLDSGAVLTPELVKEYLAFVERRRQALDVFLSTVAPEFVAGLRDISVSVMDFLARVSRALEVFTERDLVKVNALDLPEYHGRPGLVTKVEVDGAGETAVFVDFNDGGVPAWFRPAQLELVSHAHRVDPTAGEVEDRPNPFDYLPPTPGDLEPA